MDLRQYFRKLREIESKLTDEFPVVVSLETADGGKPGVFSEVSREAAAKMILESKAAVASEEQKQKFIQSLEERKKAAEKAELSKRVQVAIIADPDLVSRNSPAPGNGK